MRTDLDIFRLRGNAVVSLSGGRTSAYMLALFLEAYGGRLPPRIVVVFCNTGKEREETLEFVRTIGERWNVPIVWLEYGSRPLLRVVSFEAASRNGEPFEALIRSKQILPGQQKRFCTQELKIRTIRRYLRQILKWRTWTNVIGIRSDEPQRVVRIHARNDKNPLREFEDYLPLDAARVTQDEVMAFWAIQPFDLGLESWEGNCDGCFLVGMATMIRRIAKNPNMADWWIARERERQHLFREGRVSYQTLKDRAVHLPLIQSSPDTDFSGVPCDCTD